MNLAMHARMGRWIAIALVGLLTACQSVKTTSTGVVGVDRQQRMSALVSERDLREGAVKAYQETMSKEQAKGALNTDAAMTRRVRAIAQRLTPVTSAFRPDAPGWNWEVNVIQSDQLNAWCMPGGKIAFYSGIITRLALTDDEIAAIMGHEIAHALREHGRERASEQVTQQIGLTGVAIATGNRAVVDMASMAMQVTLSLPNSRLHETEADRIGVELAARGGYDPRAAINVWRKMAQASQGKSPEWLSTHPSAESRIKDLEVYSQRVMPLYEQARGARR
jgi:predicted Zn-dependent protease